MTTACGGAPRNSRCVFVAVLVAANWSGSRAAGSILRKVAPKPGSVNPVRDCRCKGRQKIRNSVSPSAIGPGFSVAGLILRRRFAGGGQSGSRSRPESLHRWGRGFMPGSAMRGRGLVRFLGLGSCGSSAALQGDRRTVGRATALPVERRGNPSEPSFLRQRIHDAPPPERQSASEGRAAPPNVHPERARG